MTGSLFPFLRLDCGCEAKWEPTGILAIWRSLKKCEAHRAK